MWSLILDEEEHLAKLLQWPDTDLPPQDEIAGVSKADVPYHIFLARRLRGEEGTDDGSLLQIVRRHKRTKLCLTTFDAIQARNATALSVALRKVIDEFRCAPESTKHLIEEFTCPEGTILWHIARRAKLELPKLDERLMDLVVTQESLGSG
jgi:hypothetical protein